jgi:N-acetylglucosamine-6-phosphate deacetylase
MILTNARLITPDGMRENAEIEISDGRIADIRQRRRSSSAAVDLDGNYVAPGFIDLHVHGAVGRDTMEASDDAFRAICDYHATGGTTSLLLTTATAPLDEITRALRAIRVARDTIPQIAGAHVEGPFISRHRPGAQRAEFIREPDDDSTRELLQLADVMKRITVAPEIPGAVQLIEKFTACGIAVSGGHSDAWDEQAQAAFAAGMRDVTHTFNCMSSARKQGRERVAGLLEFALSEPAIKCELIADGHHVSPTLMKMLYRAKGADGICLVTDATAGAGLPDGTGFELAGKRCVVERGVCLLADCSALAGSAARMIDLIRIVRREVGVPLHEVLRMATLNPARAAGLTSKGRMEVGADADLVVFSPEFDVLHTFISGEEIFRAKEGTPRSAAMPRDG